MTAPGDVATRDCKTCTWWRPANRPQGFRIPGGSGKCARPWGHCWPAKVRTK